MPATVRCRPLLCCVILFALAGCLGKKDGSSNQAATAADANSASGSGNANGGGSASATAPALTESATDYTPTTGPLITLRGRNFVAGAKVFIGTAECTAVALVSANELACKVPTLAVGSYDIIITNPDKGTFTLAKAFLVSPAPTVTKIAPAVQAMAGGTEVTITGTGFLNGAKVQLGPIACANPKVASATEITCVPAAGVEGQNTVYVRNPDQQYGGLLNGFTYGTPNSWRATAGTGSIESTTKSAFWTGTAWVFLNKGFSTRAGATSSVSSYNPVADQWTAIPNAGVLPDARDVRTYSTALVGNKIAVWGGVAGPPGNCTIFNTGGIFDLATNSWKKTIKNDNTPFGRIYPTAVTVGTKMVVWGGIGEADCGTQQSANSTNGGNSGVTNTGGVYDLATDTWKLTSKTNAPSPRYLQAAVSTGTKMIIWGGATQPTTEVMVGDGAVYDVATDTWKKMSMTNAPTPRAGMLFLWTGTKMAIWGGFGNAAVGQPLTFYKTGALYDPATDTWTPMSVTGAPSARGTPAGVWTGNKLVVWAGLNVNSVFNDGAVYNPATDSWTAMTGTAAPQGRAQPMAAWTGSRMLIWGGTNYNQDQITSAASYIP